MDLSDARELVLKVLDGTVLRVEHVVELLRNHPEHTWVEIGCSEHLAQLRLLLMQALIDRLDAGELVSSSCREMEERSGPEYLQLAFEQYVLQPALLLDVVDGRLELLVEIIPFLPKPRAGEGSTKRRPGPVARQAAYLFDVMVALFQDLVLPRQISQLSLKDVEA